MAATAVQGFSIKQNGCTKHLIYRNPELMDFLSGFFQAISVSEQSSENKDFSCIQNCISEHCEVLNSS